MDATSLFTNSNLFNSNSVPPVAQLCRRFVSIRLNQLTRGRCSELSQLRSGCSARGFDPVDRRSIWLQFVAKSGYWKSHVVPASTSDAAALSSDAIVLHVQGMLCEGCVASVQRILESQEPVSSASVNLTTETAVVWPVSDAKVEPGWQKDLGQALAKHLTSCGFESSIRDQGAIDADAQSYDTRDSSQPNPSLYVILHREIHLHLSIYPNSVLFLPFTWPKQSLVKHYVGEPSVTGLNSLVAFSPVTQICHYISWRIMSPKHELTCDILLKSTW